MRWACTRCNYADVSLKDHLAVLLDVVNDFRIVEFGMVENWSLLGSATSP